MTWLRDLKISIKLVSVSWRLLGIFFIGQLGTVNGPPEALASNFMPAVALASAMNTVTSIFRIVACPHITAVDDKVMAEDENGSASI